MPDELIDVIDKKGNIIGKKLKSLVHKDGDWHKGAHVWIVIDGKILLQKRSERKDIFPGRFDVSCAGHVKSGETYEEAAIRELKEELGIEADKSDLLLLDKRPQITRIREKGIISREIIKVFLLKKRVELKDLSVYKDEISEVKLFDLDELLNLLKNKPEMFVEDREYFLDTIEKIRKITSL
ncbi:MAG: hydrolase [Candidatus Aenigmatarchaeota archaeon]|nr:MAG: hydrolase [Candidatus Aenigmarchaeota archaeon]